MRECECVSKGRTKGGKVERGEGRMFVAYKWLSRSWKMQFDFPHHLQLSFPRSNFSGFWITAFHILKLNNTYPFLTFNITGWSSSILLVYCYLLPRCIPNNHRLNNIFLHCFRSLGTFQYIPRIFTPLGPLSLCGSATPHRKFIIILLHAIFSRA